MIKYLVATATVILAGVPAAAGLTGNTSFSREVPVRVPVQARTGAPADRPTAGSSPTASPTNDDATGDQGPRCCEARDDRGGVTGKHGGDHGSGGHGSDG